MNKVEAYVVLVPVETSCSRADVENLPVIMPSYEVNMFEWVAKRLGIETGWVAIYTLSDFTQDCNDQGIDIESVWLGYFMTEVRND